MEASEWIHLSGDSCVKMPEMSVQRMDQRRAVPPISNRAAFLLSRLLKILANVSKGVARLLYVFTPGWRLQIPASSPAWIRSGRGMLPSQNRSGQRRQIPSVLWQTNYASRVTLPVKLNYYCNRIFAASFHYRFVSDAEIEEFIGREFPGRIERCYRRLAIGAAKADLWRLLVLYRHGGIYIDIDGHLVWPIDRLLKGDPAELFVISKDGRFTNYFMASAPENPHVWALIEEALRRIENPTTNNVYHLTGPGLMDDLLADVDCTTSRVEEVCLQGNFTNKFFQYMDKPGGDWVTAKKTIAAVSPE